MINSDSEKGSKPPLLRQTTFKLQRAPTKKGTLRSKLNKAYLQSNKFAKVFGNGLASLFQKQHQKKQTFINNKKIANLIDGVQPLTFVQRLEKAHRHFEDAYFCRDVRNDLELKPNQFISFCYHLQTNNFFQDCLFVLSFAFMFLSFWEPANRHDHDFQYDGSMRFIELSILSCYTLDLLLTIIHLGHDVDRSFKRNFITNKKFVIKFVLILLFISDFLYFNFNTFDDRLRFSRYFRPCQLCIYNKELRRTAKSIFMSTQQILQMILFFLLMNIFWGIIGWQVIGDLDGEVPYDKYIQNFDNLLTSTAILYALSSPDIYPDCMLPAYYVSELYLIYFLSFCILFQLLFLPIPVAIVFDAFRKHRAELAMRDTILQHESLLASFVTLDYEDKKRLDFPVFQKFMKRVYLNKKRYLPRIHRLFINLDTSQTRYLSINDFFNIIDQMESDQNLNRPSFRDWKSWIILRSYINKYLYFKIIAKSTYIEIVMFIVVLFNSIIVIITMSMEGSFVETLDQVDDILVYIYIVEAIIKIVGFGIEKYFEDDWNMFDFVLILVSLLSILSSNLVSFFRTVKTAKSTKIVRVTKLNRMFRSIKGIRSLKVVNFLVIGAESVIEFKLLIQRLFLCIPLIFKLIPIALSTFYIYTLIGLEFLDTDFFPFKDDPEGNAFDMYTYSDFTSFGNAFLIMFQICLGTSWNMIVMDYAYKFQDYLSVILFFYSFHILINLVILALVKGIIWEVFTIVEQNVADKKEEDEDDKEYNAVIDSVKERKEAYDCVLVELEFSIDNLEQEESLPPFPRKLSNNRVLAMRRQETILIGDEQQIPQRFISNVIVNRQSIKTNLRRQTIFEKDSEDQEFNIKMEKIKIYFRNTFKTVKQLRYMLHKKTEPNNRLNTGLIFDSEDEDSLIEYHKQISDNIQSQSQFQYFKRLQDSLKNDEHYAKQKIEFKNNQIINQNYVFKKALLKDTNNEKVKKFEVDYFQCNYGKIFDVINQVDLGPLLKYEGFILHNLERSLRHNSSNFMPFINLLSLMEKNISQIMLCKGSIFKFVFQDNFNNWIYLDTLDNSVIPCKTENGPWHFEDEFLNKTIYTSLDHFNRLEEDEIYEELYLQFYNIKAMVDQYNSSFENFVLGQTILDCLLMKYIPEEEMQDKISDISLKYVQQEIQTDSLPVQVSKLAVFIIMYSGDQNNDKNKFGYQKKQVKFETIDNLKQQFLSDEERINEFISLPLNYVIEFLEDLKGILEKYGDKLFIKMNQFLNHRTLKLALAKSKPKFPIALTKHKEQTLECPLIQKTQLSNDTFIFKFALPSKNHILGIHVGQHIKLKEIIKTKEAPEGELVERKYTPISPVDQKGSFDLLIKVYRANEHPKFPNGGKLTSWIEFMKPDETIHITGPFGRLIYLGNGMFQINKNGTLIRKKYSNVVMIAGGSGITPMYQIIEAAAQETKSNLQLSLLFANKSRDDILLYEELMQYQRMKRLELHFTLDMPPSGWTGFSGFVTKEMTEQAFTNLGQGTLALSCGPPMMNTLAQTNFQSLGVNQDDIFTF